MKFGYLYLHIIALITGFVLDLLLGDPHNALHPVEVIGAEISLCNKLFHKKKGKTAEIMQGILTVIIVVLTTFVVTAAILVIAYKIDTLLGLAVESAMTYQVLAIKSLRDESMKVFDALRTKGLEEGRKAVSMIVGRDTDSLSKKGVIKAAVETVAENTSDGIIGPMLYLTIGGPVLGMIYKAINTMDSMIGYKNETYEYYGKVAARLDDIVNLIPARLSAFLMITASLIGGKDYSFPGAIHIYVRDRYKHKSPNSAHTEAVCAGALGLQLAGDAYYFGKKVEKPYIGDKKREPELKDIPRVCRLMYITAFLGLISGVSVLLLITVVFR